MAKNGIKIVEDALEGGFASKGAKLSYLVIEKSDYKDFIRVYVVSDFFRRKSTKERLGEVFSMLREFGAESAITKISLCVAMTQREYEREFGRGTFLGVEPYRSYRRMKSKRKAINLANSRRSRRIRTSGAN